MKASRFIYYDDHALVRYERDVLARLDAIIAQLELGRGANLGHYQSTWYPDEVAKVDFLVMPGILAPLIKVRVSYRPTADEGVRIEELPGFYSPYLWVGSTMLNSIKDAGADDNPNCGLWGYPVESNLYGIEPGWEEAEGFAAQLQRSVETELPGPFRGQGPAAIGDYEPLGDPLFEGLDEELWNDGFFGAFQNLVSDQVVVSANGMVATQGTITNATAPPEAYTGIDDPQYWTNSIIVDPRGFQLPEGVYTGRWVWVRKEDGTTLGFNEQVTVSGDVLIPCRVQRGRYEISALAVGFTCECTEADVHVRMVLGRSSVPTLRREWNKKTGALVKQTLIPKGRVAVIDFFPASIGRGADIARSSFRNSTLGGFAVGATPGNLPLCGEDQTQGPNARGPGYWDLSIFVDVENGDWSLERATENAPFFDPSCPPSYAESTGYDDGCGTSGCAHPVVYPDSYYTTFPLGPCIPVRDVPQSLLNLLISPYGGGALTNVEVFIAPFPLLLGQLAEIVEIRSGGRVCYARIVGNDGGFGGPCEPCQPFDYGRVFHARGVNAWNDFSDTDAGGFTVGQLVVVAGMNIACGNCQVWPVTNNHLYVAPPMAGGFNFLTEFYRQLRCPEHPQNLQIPALEVLKGFLESYRVSCEREGVVPATYDVDFGCVDGRLQMWIVNPPEA